MPRQNRQTEEEGPPGAPDWMVTFSDCMTLLLTFFVLLLSFASFDDETLPALGRAFQHALPSIGNSQKTEVDSIFEKEETKNSEKIDKGTETKPLLQTPDNAKPQAEQKPLDFKNLKVFSVDSSRFFWGQAAAISAEGRLVLDALAQFLHSQPSRVVISENGPPGTEDLGLNRAWAIVEYLTGPDCKPPVPREKFSVTATTMMRQGPPEARRVEITLLEKSLY